MRAMRASGMNHNTCAAETLPKLPMPQTIYDFTPSAVLKKLSNEMALLAR